MLRTMMLKIVLGVLVAGALFVAPVVSPTAPFAAKAEAGPRALARRIIRHREHVLLRAERYHKRQIHREQRQINHMRRELHRLRK